MIQDARSLLAPLGLRTSTRLAIRMGIMLLLRPGLLCIRSGLLSSTLRIFMRVAMVHLIVASTNHGPQLWSQPLPKPLHNFL